MKTFLILTLTTLCSWCAAQRQTTSILEILDIITGKRTMARSKLK